MKTKFTASFLISLLFSPILIDFLDSRTPQWKGAEFDLFDQEGHYLYKIIMPVIPKVIAHGNLFSCEDDQDTGYIMVKRYKIQNWDKIQIMKGN